MNIKIGPYLLTQRTSYSKIQVFDKDGNILDNEISDKIIYDYNRQKNNPENFFNIDGKTINGYTDNKIDYLFIPEGITEISAHAFIGASTKYIYFPDSLTVLGPESFKMCEYLEDLILPSSLQRLGICAFECCENLKSVIFNSPITELSRYCFSSCVSLKDFIIPDSVLVINDGALSYCRDLEKINIPKDLVCFGSRPFAGSEIKTLVFNHNLYERKNAENAYVGFLVDSEIRKIEISGNVQTIDKDFFKYSFGTITDIEYHGTKKEFKEFKKNNKWLLHFLRHAKIDIKEDINELIDSNTKSEKSSNFTDIKMR